MRTARASREAEPIVFLMVAAPLLMGTVPVSWAYGVDDAAVLNADRVQLEDSRGTFPGRLAGGRGQRFCSDGRGHYVGCPGDRTSRIRCPNVNQPGRTGGAVASEWPPFAEEVANHFDREAYSADDGGRVFGNRLRRLLSALADYDTVKPCQASIS